jgi:hypothetical protein
MKKTLALMGLLLGTALTAPALAQDSVNFVHNTYRTGAFSGSGFRSPTACATTSPC